MKFFVHIKIKTNNKNNLIQIRIWFFTLKPCPWKWNNKKIKSLYSCEEKKTITNVSVAAVKKFFVSVGLKKFTFMTYINKTIAHKKYRNWQFYGEIFDKNAETDSF